MGSHRQDRGFAPTGPNGPTLQEEVDRLEAGLSRPQVGGFWMFFCFFDTIMRCRLVFFFFWGGWVGGWVVFLKAGIWGLRMLDVTM